MSVRFKLCIVAIIFPLIVQGQSPIQINSNREIFVDNYLIDTLLDTRLVMHTPVDEGPVMYFDQPWEGHSQAYITILKDEDIYRAYYRGWNYEKDRSEPQVTCYAESKDGINWIKPVLGLFESDGSKENNIILTTEPETHNFSPFIDTNPDVIPSQKFKALGGKSPTGLIPYVSADGIHWEKIQDSGVIKKGAFDSQNVVFWSESEGHYVCYFRTFTETKIRSVSRATSKDFINWSEPLEMTYGDTPNEHLYTQQTSPYFRAPHIYVAIGSRYVPDRRSATEEQHKELKVHPNQRIGLMDIILMTTRGDNVYDRTFMEAFLRPGIGFNNWCARCNYPSLNVVQTSPREMSLYVSQDYTQPTSHLHRYSMRLDGFTSIYAPYTGGEVITRPFIFSGKELEINYSTSAAGEIRIEIQDDQGNPMPGYTLEESDIIIGDEIKKIVTWEGSKDVSEVSTKPVRLHIFLKDANLYSIKFN